MTTPALLQLRRALPDARITLLTHEKLAALWEDHPAIDDRITFGAKESPFNIARRLRPHRFDAALLLPNSPRTALEVFLAGIPRRVGGTWPWRNFFLTEVVPHPARRILMQRLKPAEVQRRVAAAAAGASPTGRHAYPPEGHQMHHYLRLAAAFGASTDPVAPHLPVTLAELEAARRRFDLGTEGAVARWIGVNAGAEYGPAKRWPRARFIEVLRTVAQEPNTGFVFFGGPADVEGIAAIATALGDIGRPTRNLAGRTTLRELVASLQCCRVLLTNDTGPMHVAAAVGVPVVVPFGSTSPELTGPGLPGDPRHALVLGDAPCAPCFLRDCPVDFRCMESIQATRVVRAIIDRLGPANP